MWADREYQGSYVSPEHCEEPDENKDEPVVAPVICISFGAVILLLFFFFFGLFLFGVPSLMYTKVAIVEEES